MEWFRLKHIHLRMPESKYKLDVQKQSPHYLSNEECGKKIYLSIYKCAKLREIYTKYLYLWLHQNEKQTIINTNSCHYFQILTENLLISNLDDITQ